MNGIEQIKKLCAKLSFSQAMRNKLAVELAVMIYEEALTAKLFPDNASGITGITPSKLRKYLVYYDFEKALDDEGDDHHGAKSRAGGFLREVFGDRELTADEKNCFAVLYAALEDRYEKHDGSGYPKGKYHKDICPLAHITVIADTVADKKLSCVSEKDILCGIDEAAGTYFSPKLTEVAGLAIKRLFDADREWLGLLGEESSVQIDRYPIADCFKNNISGYESRMILRDKNGDGMPPEMYVPVAERTGRAVSVTLLHIEELCRELSAGRLEGGGAFCPLWVSVPAVCLTGKIFSISLKRILKKYSVYPENFVFQVTETALGLKDPSFADSVSELSGCGISFAVEHFGNEYSSLAVLSDFDAAAVKLDRVFSEAVADNKKTYEIVKSIAGLAENLGVSVVATGVDSPMAKDILLQAGIRYMQGKLFKDTELL